MQPRLLLHINAASGPINFIFFAAVKLQASNFIILLLAPNQENVLN